MTKGLANHIELQARWSPSQPFQVSSRNACGEERCMTTIKTTARETADRRELKDKCCEGV